MTHAMSAATVAELVPVADAALTARSRDDVARDIRRALLRLVGEDTYRACDIAAEAIVALAEHQARSLGHIRLADDFPDNQPLGGRSA